MYSVWYVVIFFSHSLGSPWGLLLIRSSGLWLFLCFSLWYFLYSFAFLQVHYPAMITRGTSDMHRGSNVWKNILQCLLEGVAQKTLDCIINVALVVFFCALFHVSYSVRVTSLPSCTLIRCNLPQCIDNPLIIKKCMHCIVSQNEDKAPNISKKLFIASFYLTWSAAAGLPHWNMYISIVKCHWVYY